VHALVLELVEGPTLADMLDGSGLRASGSKPDSAQGLRSKVQSRRALPVDEALAIARQIADALEVAHEQSIIHRDLKPANIKVREDGTVKVLDFGLAKLVEAGEAGRAGGAGLHTQSPTITTPAMTQAGMILGTAAYMSPEQAKGKPADKRSDIWAFGCVFYEMLTGTRAFDAEDTTETLAAILRAEPDWTALPLDTPASIRRVLSRCLRKDARRRLQHMGDVRNELDEAEASGTEMTAAVPPLRSGARIAWGLAAVSAIVAVGAIATAFFLSSRAPGRPAEARLDVTTPPASQIESFALSPDGRMLTYAAIKDGRSQLWTRSLDATEPRPIPGTENATLPFWSPDSRNIAFFANRELKRTDLDGRSVQTLTSIVSPGGGWWADDGTILFSPNSSNGSIYRISKDGGQPAPVNAYQRGVGDHFPQLLPDGRHFLYAAGLQGFQDETRGIYVNALDGSNRGTRILDADRAIYAAGQIWFVRQGSLFAQRFDPAGLALNGDAAVIAHDVASRLGGAISASQNGVVAYRTGGEATLQQLVWFDRNGKRGATVGEPFAQNNPFLSRNGRDLVLQRIKDSNTDIWHLDLTREAFTRLTFEPGIDGLPVSSPDGRRVVFASSRGGGQSVYTTALDRPGSADVFYAGTKYGVPQDWSADGRYVLLKLIEITTSGIGDLEAVPVAEPQKTIAITRTPYDERNGQFSPDGQWVAYESNEAGRFEIYIQPFPGPGQKVPVSTGGGTQVRWRADGSELFYVAPDGRLMAVPIRVGRASQSPEIGAAVPLFRSPIRETSSTFSRQQYVVSPNGQQFLMTTTEESTTPPITMILNWRPPASPAGRTNESR
jgi:eukaryotic-like serine/threonine-protein kinase